MLFDAIGAAETLEDLLDHERGLILAGRIEEVTRKAARKSQLLASLAGDAGSKSLARIQRKAQRNQELLLAAARGLKAAQSRIRDVGANKGPMRTYGADGAMRDMARPPRKPGINHRA